MAEVTAHAILIKTILNECTIRKNGTAVPLHRCAVPL